MSEVPLYRPLQHVPPATVRAKSRVPRKSAPGAESTRPDKEPVRDKVALAAAFNLLDRLMVGGGHTGQEDTEVSPNQSRSSPSIAYTTIVS